MTIMLLTSHHNLTASMSKTVCFPVALYGVLQSVHDCNAADATDLLTGRPRWMSQSKTGSFVQLLITLLAKAVQPFA